MFSLFWRFFCNGAKIKRKSARKSQGIFGVGIYQSICCHITVKYGLYCIKRTKEKRQNSTNYFHFLQITSHNTNSTVTFGHCCRCCSHFFAIVFLSLGSACFFSSAVIHLVSFCSASLCTFSIESERILFSISFFWARHFSTYRQSVVLSCILIHHFED